MDHALELFGREPSLWIGFAAVLGAVVGSFLNVVAHRLPLMLEHAWRRDCRAFLELPSGADEPKPWNLFHPPSTCTHCGQGIRFYHNVPVLGYLALKGRCAHCGAAISMQYPLVEAVCAFLFALVAWRCGAGLQAGFAMVFTASLVCLSAIDLRKQLLPDCIVLPLLWLGLLLSLIPLYVDSGTAILGAVGGYLSLWTVFQLFRLVSGKEGMGFGDFKLLAAIGAWVGWQSLPLIILLAAASGAIVGIALLATRRVAPGQPIPFGPYLAAAGYLGLLWGEDLQRVWLY